MMFLQYSVLFKLSFAYLINTHKYNLCRYTLRDSTANLEIEARRRPKSYQYNTNAQIQNTLVPKIV